MTNRYDKPAESNIQNTYVPLPMELLYKVAQHKQQQYDEGYQKELMLGEAAVDGVKAREYAYDYATGKNVRIADYDEAQSYLNDFNTKLDGIASRIGTADKGSPIYRMELEKLKRDLQKAKSSTGVLGRTTRNAETLEAYDKEFRKDPTLMTKRWRANQYSEALNEYSQSGKVGEFTSGIGLGEDVDRIKGLTEHLDKMRMTLQNTYATAAGGYTYEGYSKWISPERIRSAAEAIISEGSIGRDLQAEAYNMKMRGYSNDEIKATMTQKTNDLVNGMVNIFVESDARQSIGSDTSFYRGLEWAEDHTVNQSTSDLPIAQTEYEQKLNALRRVNINDKDKIVTGRSFKTRVPGGSEVSETILIDEKKTASDNQMLNEFKEQFPTLVKGLSNKQVLDKAIKYYEDLQTQGGSRYDFVDSDANNALHNQIFNNLDVGNFTVIDKENQTTNNVTGRDNILQEFGLGRKELPKFQELLSKTSVGIDFNNGKFVAQIPKMSGDNVKDLKHVEFEGDNESRQVLSKAKNVNQMFHAPSLISDYDREAKDVNTGKTVKLNDEYTEFIGVYDGQPLYAAVTGDKDFTNKGNRSIWLYSPNTGEVEQTTLHDINKKYTEVIGQRLKAIGKNLK